MYGWYKVCIKHNKIIYELLKRLTVECLTIRIIVTDIVGDNMVNLY